MAYNNRGNAKNYLKDYEDAIEDFDKSLEISSTHNGYFNRGVTKELLNDYEGSIEDYNKSLEINPEDIQSRLKCGYAKFKLERYEDAIEDYKCVLEKSPDNADAMVSMAMAQERLNMDDKALLNYSKAIEIDNEYMDAYMNRAILCAKMQNYELSKSDILQIFEFDVFKSDYRSTYKRIKDFVQDRTDDKSVKFLQEIEELFKDKI